MDGESFDRLSVVIHRLRDQATRRNALRLLLGGSVAAVAGLTTEDADARRRKKHKNKHRNRHKNRNRRKNCRVGAIRCRRSRDCCFGKCRNGFCFGGGGGGGDRCNGQRCPGDRKCCRFNGIDMCLPRDHFACRGDGGFCPIGWEDCGWNGGIRQCCGPDQQCCNNGRCCPDFSDWRCGDIACEFHQDADINSEAVETQPFEDPVAVTEIDPEEYE